MLHSSFYSDRLHMLLINEDHAAMVHPLFQDPSLYTYIPSDPPALIKLQEQYKYWEGRESPDGREYWLNYVMFLGSTGSFVGTLQAGITRETKEASVAYMVVTQHQNKGLATEAVQMLISHLRTQYGVRCVKAWVDTRNTASIRLLEKAGMRRIQFIEKADHFKGQDSDEYVYQVDLPR